MQSWKKDMKYVELENAHEICRTGKRTLNMQNWKKNMKYVELEKDLKYVELEKDMKYVELDGLTRAKGWFC